MDGNNYQEAYSCYTQLETMALESGAEGEEIVARS